MYKTRIKSFLRTAIEICIVIIMAFVSLHYGSVVGDRINDYYNRNIPVDTIFESNQKDISEYTRLVTNFAKHTEFGIYRELIDYTCEYNEWYCNNHIYEECLIYNIIAYNRGKTTAKRDIRIMRFTLCDFVNDCKGEIPLRQYQYLDSLCKASNK